MEIVKKMNVPATYIYEKILESVIFDVRHNTGETLNRLQLRNFEYIKEYSKNSRAKIKIEKLVDNECYAYKTSTARNDFFAQYEIRPVDEYSCELHYTEKMNSFGTLQKINDTFVGILMGFFKKKQFKNMLQQIENSY
ncbi:DUF3284 domain-containing protein [Enterococcus sp. LJL51]|uniref:DUF3284 domain-containing protein n=1 Tax=Enterococcus sp. LJL51 TaxID=3416656 RepID=UPI003CF7D776